MFLLRRPTEDFIKQTIESQCHQRLTYPDIGLTVESRCPSGYSMNQWQAVIGKGQTTFLRAKEAITRLHILDLGWLQVVSRPESICEQAPICTLIRMLGIYSLQVAKVVHVDNKNPEIKFGFSYGTLPAYPLSGEERFTVSYDPHTQDVVYEIFSFSRPANYAIRLGQPYLRYAQRRFCRDSVDAIQKKLQEPVLD